jgi:putative cell wall-binding protein
MRGWGMRRGGTRGAAALACTFALMVVGVALSGGGAAEAAAAEVRVPVGPDDVTYTHVDELVLGPAAVAVADDGTVWVADAAKQRLLHYDRDGSRLATVDVAPHRSKAVYGLRATGGRVYLGTEDPATERNHVLVLADGGRDLTSYPHPAGLDTEDGVTGLALVRDGAIVLEIEGGASYVELVDAAGRQTNRALTSLDQDGRGYATTAQDWHHWTASAGDVVVDVPLDHGGGVRFLTALPDRSFLLGVDDVRFAERIRVDSQVRRYSATGRFLGAHRRDLTGQQAEITQYYDDGPGGALYGVDAAATHLAVAPLTFAPSLQPLLPPAPARRLAAVDNVEAALVWSRLAYPDGAPVALLGRADVFADALAASAAQGALGGPLLLTGGAGLDRDVAAELRRLGVRRVHILGGEAAVSGAVESALARAGYTVTRAAGRSRIETAVALAADVLPAADTAILTRAFGAGGDPSQAFADALAVGGWAAQRRWPVLLTHGDALSPATRTYLQAAGIRTVHLVGGTAAVGAGVADELTSLGLAVTRVAGDDRAGTAAAVATRRGLAEPTAAILLDGRRADAWAPGLAAATFAADRAAPVLLTSGAALPPASRSWLSTAGTRPLPLVCAPYTHHRACSAGVDAAGWD